MTTFTEAQIAAMGGVIQGMLDKALRSKDRPNEGDEGGPPGDGGSGETGECDKGKGTWGRLYVKGWAGCMRGAGLVGKGAAAGVQVSFHPLSCIPCLGGRRELGSMPSAEALCGLGLGQREVPGQQQLTEALQNPFAPLIPWLTSLSASGDPQEKPEQKPARYLVAKGLPTLPTKLVEKVWNLGFLAHTTFAEYGRARKPLPLSAGQPGWSAEPKTQVAASGDRYQISQRGCAVSPSTWRFSRERHQRWFPAW